MTFNTLGLSETLLRSIEESGYTTPTKIQSQAIPAILEGKDVMAAAQTGTGKTAAFTLPLLQLLDRKPGSANGKPRALVLTPTRELAAQVQDSIQTYGKNEKLYSAVVFGGVNINPQKKILRRGVDVLIATPGRLLDLHQQKDVDLSAVEILVLDEADRMLDMGFIHAIKKVLSLLPRQRQNLMFSATFSNDIRNLARTICRNPVEIDVAPRNSTVEAITQKLYMVEKERKADMLSYLISSHQDQVLVFSRTKHGANKLVKRLARDKIAAAAIHGNKSQNQRTKALADFKDNKVQVLVATDIAARGLDIAQLAQVINFDLPNVPEDYVHRIGRTGRAGAVGQAISLVSQDENKQLRDIERLIKRKIDRADPVTLSAASAEAGSERDVERPRKENNSRPRRAPHKGARAENRSGGKSKQRSFDPAGGEKGNRPRKNSRRARPQKDRGAQPESGWVTVRSSLPGAP